MDEINQMTIQFLVKKKEEKVKSKKPSKKEIKFYKKRMMNLLREYLYNEEMDLMNDVKQSLDSYIMNSIQYFQLMDKTELYQKEYENLEEEKEENILEKIKNHYPFEEEEVCIPFFPEEKKIKTMDHYVNKIYNTEEEEFFFPQMKKINIRSKDFREKGIHKKKNILNTYENNTEKNKPP